jgi:hypothetical protein
MSADHSVVNYDTAVDHEVNKHLAYAADKLRDWLGRLETPSNQQSCAATCTSVERLEDIALAKSRDALIESKKNQ